MMAHIRSRYTARKGHPLLGTDTSTTDGAGKGIAGRKGLEEKPYILERISNNTTQNLYWHPKKESIQCIRQQAAEDEPEEQEVPGRKET